VTGSSHPEGATGPTRAVPAEIAAARDEIVRLCEGRGRMTHVGLAGRDWTMCVPARDDDSDMIFLALVEFAAKADVERAALTARVDAAERALNDRDDSLAAAWVVIANAGGGDWTRETTEWQEAAERWRDTVMPSLGARDDAAMQERGE
jgi:hypothetical protein